MQSELLAAVRNPLMRRNIETDTVSAILFLRQRQQLLQSKNRIAVFGTAAAPAAPYHKKTWTQLNTVITNSHGAGNQHIVW